MLLSGVRHNVILSFRESIFVFCLTLKNTLV
jgi:hypothetical protein